MTDALSAPLRGVEVSKYPRTLWVLGTWSLHVLLSLVFIDITLPWIYFASFLRGNRNKCDCTLAWPLSLDYPYYPYSSRHTAPYHTNLQYSFSQHSPTSHSLYTHPQTTKLHNTDSQSSNPHSLAISIFALLCYSLFAATKLLMKYDKDWVSNTTTAEVKHWSVFWAWMNTYTTPKQIKTTWYGADSVMT